MVEIFRISIRSLPEQTIRKAMTWTTAFVILLVLGLQLGFPVWDWRQNYQPWIVEFLHGQNPYLHVLYVPPWILLLLAPVAILPDRLSDAALFALATLSIILLARRAGLKPFYVACLLLSFPVYKELQHRQLDWLVLFGTLLPPVWGLFLVLAKPQVGIGIALFWAWDLFKKGGVTAVVQAFAPVLIAYAASFLIFGPYLFQATRELGQSYNASLWPYAIPVGLLLLVRALRRGEIYTSAAASPFLAPYVAIYSWAAALLGVARNRWWFALLCLASWVVLFVKPF